MARITPSACTSSVGYDAPQVVRTSEEPPRSDRLLFTPGPLTTTPTVKQAMARDLGSRDHEFIEVVRDVRQRLLEVAAVDVDEYDVVLLPGSGTTGLEAVLSSVTPATARWMVVVNGAYGRRLADILEAHGIEHEVFESPPDQALSLSALRERLEVGPTGSTTHVAAVHCETSTGLVNDIRGIGELANACGARFLVDAMSSFGGIPIFFDDCRVDYLTDIGGLVSAAAETLGEMRCAGSSEP